MTLPIRTTMSDVRSICSYLNTKPTGASMPEAKAALNSKVLDGRKISAYKFWGLIEDAESKIKITERGRLVARDNGAQASKALAETITEVRPYFSVVERAVHRKELTLTAVEVAAHLHEHFPDEASNNDKILNDQAICFFQLAEGCDLGNLIVGRKGQPTRFEFNEENASALISGSVEGGRQGNPEIDQEVSPEFDAVNDEEFELPATKENNSEPKKVFITHGKNGKILSQVKELVSYGKFEAVVAKERETAAKSVPDKVMDEMRGCSAAVIHVGLEGMLFDKEGNEIPQINGNVLIEIGAALALYGKNFILLVEDSVTLPSNLQGLYECRYSGSELNMDATMKILKAFNAFK